MAGVDALGDVLAPHELGEEAPDEGVTGACFYFVVPTPARTTKSMLVKAV